jgi:NitT/TauT family transport system permease protein/sulfonate transport system permease protein
VSRGASGRSTTARKAGSFAAFIVVLGALWVFGSTRLPSYILPSPQNILASALAFFTTAQKLGHVAATFGGVLASIALSFVAGSTLALIAHYASWTEPLIHHRIGPFLNSFSGIGWTLLAVIWFGVSPTTVIFSISVVLLPFAMINFREGLRALDAELGEMSRSFTRSRLRSFLLIVLPALFPFAVATLRIMFGVAWKVALTAELFGGSVGLGYLINLARQEYDTATIFTVIAFIIVAVYLADQFVFAPLERLTQRRYGGTRK